MRLDAAVNDALYRLDDEDLDIWSRSEMELYVRDGYDKFCRQTKCVFDIHVVENLPPVGNYSTDLERWHAEHKPGMGLSDRKIHFTGEHERNLTSLSLEGPISATDRGSHALYTATTLPTTVATGRLPDGTVEVIRVSWNEITLTAVGSQQLRQLDPNYETTEGDPRFWTWDKDGINTIRFVPVAGGDAVYDTADGMRGALKETSGTNTIVGTRGVLKERAGDFPAGGPRGTPRRIHPVTDNFKIEIARLGRDPQAFDFEIPRNYSKYVVFWAMARALRRDGPGQDKKLAQHYEARFELGVARMKRRMQDFDRERAGRVAYGPPGQPSFALGEPTLPWEYGVGNDSVSGGY